jgi:hypothetical protein
MRDPRTPQEWQEAFDLATALRMIADCKMYGLIKGGPEINLERCDRILARGAKRGLSPSKAAADLAMEYIAAVNSQPRDDNSASPGQAIAQTHPANKRRTAPAIARG